MTINKVLVTGSEGRIGRVVLSDLLEHGYDVTRADKNASVGWGAKVVDFEDMGQVVGVMHGHDAVIHLAAIPTPTRHTAEVVFRNNIMSTFHVLEAATILGIKNVVIASSLSALGFAYMHRHFEPTYIPVDEEHPLLSQDAYGLVKQLGEDLAEGFLRRTPDMSLVSLRFTLVVDDPVREFLAERRDAPAGENFLGAFATYVDVRDTAASCRLAMEYNTPGHEAFYICAPNIYLNQPVEDLFATYYPGDYPIADHIRGNISPVDCRKAERLLGWKPKYNWDGTELQF